MAKKRSELRGVWVLCLATVYFVLLATTAVALGVSPVVSIACGVCAVAFGICALIFRLTVKNRRAQPPTA